MYHQNKVFFHLYTCVTKVFHGVTLLEVSHMTGNSLKTKTFSYSAVGLQNIFTIPKWKSKIIENMS